MRKSAGGLGTAAGGSVHLDQFGKCGKHFLGSGRKFYRDFIIPGTACELRYGTDTEFDMLDTVADAIAWAVG